MKFNLIYADPPWLYDDARTSKSMGMARSAYECMPTEDICAIPVRPLVAGDCMLCLWATSPKLPDAFRVIDAWGFKYTTVLFTWLKVSPYATPPIQLADIYSGLGHYTNSNTEYVLGGRIGKYWRDRMDIKQVVIAPRGAHSEKPDIVRTRIGELFGPCGRVELFARKPCAGWTTLGDVIDGKDIVESTTELAAR